MASIGLPKGFCSKLMQKNTIDNKWCFQGFSTESITEQSLFSNSKPAIINEKLSSFLLDRLSISSSSPSIPSVMIESLLSQLWYGHKLCFIFSSEITTQLSLFKCISLCCLIGKLYFQDFIFCGNNSQKNQMHEQFTGSVWVRHKKCQDDLQVKETAGEKMDKAKCARDSRARGGEFSRISEML